MLQQENAELQSELDTANKLLNRDTRLLIKKYQERKDKKRDTTCQVWFGMYNIAAFVKQLW